MDGPAKIKPLGLATVSRDDIRNSLHTYFQSHAAKHQQHQVRSLVGAGASSTAPKPGAGRKRVYAFVQVQKKKVSLASKRIFGHSSGASKSYILCVSVQEGAQSTASSAQLHYLQFLSTLSVDVRQSWDIGKLDVVENNGSTTEKKRGSFALYFEQEDTPWQWLVAENEGPNAMMEFIWSLCALAVEQKKMLPRLVRFNIEELNEVAIQLNLQKKYGVDVDLIDHMAATKKTTSTDNQSEDAANGDSNAADGSKGSALQRLSAAENADAAQLLAGVNWNDVNLFQIEENLKKKLRNLEDENLTFLLSFEGAVQPTTAPAAGATASKVPPNGGGVTAVDKILRAIDTLVGSVKRVQEWTNQSEEVLERTSLNMTQFESLNNQLELHFKNSVALEEMLERMMQAIEIPREQMGILLKPVQIFPVDPTQAPGAPAGGSGVTASSVGEVPDANTLHQRLEATMTTIVAVDKAIRSTREFPTSELIAFRSRGDELTKLAKAFSDKLAAAFDVYLRGRVRQWALESRAATAAALAASGGTSPTRSKLTFHREHRDVSSTMRSAIESSRASRATTTFDGEAEMDWSVTNEPFHGSVSEYEGLFGRLYSLDPSALQAARLVYIKNLTSVYGPHMHSLFRCLKDKLPRSNKPMIAKPQALQSWSFHLSSSHIGDALGASPLMQQALDHIVPLVTQEQAFLRRTFFPAKSLDDEPEGLMVMMEGVFEKLLKRMNEFGEAAAGRNILDALALVVLVSGQLDLFQEQSAFLYNVMVSFQLSLKRILIKFTEEQETWINNHNSDTRMAGVLSPIQKTLTMVGRLEESVCGKTDDSTLASIYHRIVPSTLQWLDKVAESKPKYASLTRLENYLFIAERLTAINPSRDLPLGQYAVQAYAKYNENVALYIKWIWEHELKFLAPTFVQIEELLKTLPQQEIQFHSPRQQVRKTIETTAATFEKSVKSMHDRMKKHFSVNPKMLPVIWKLLVESGRARFESYEKIAAECYQLRMDPSAQRAIELLSKFSS
ncbi:TPA: hypothetical protein N0F65_012976 [Lagenidium giganteum]|uniref:Exocyst complex component Sec3 C-terminal domain-containing protein n=1 Tax=Lagenidium giganteum TaxID=4803 RepID=A0AAV2Z481_9STRA|nr:TPA: hypothetical protein N0F65_012976 [Lagenidium giganteum]